MTQLTEYIGVISRTHGVDGSVLLSDTPSVTVELKAGDPVAIGYSMEFSRVYTIASFKQTLQRCIVRFQEITTPETATSLVDHALYVAPSHIKADTDNRYTVADIEGCVVYDRQDVKLGEIKEVWLLPANDVWVLLTADGDEIPLPVIDQVVKSVNVATKTIVIDMMDGLSELAKNSPPEDMDE
ncbi:MAG: 16S rRNA processing protein RimM [Ignavibacteria bacterium]|nr:16S rRNA processing protein RimM [Ignavibacteria bacterium]